MAMSCACLNCFSFVSITYSFDSWYSFINVPNAIMYNVEPSPFRRISDFFGVSKNFGAVMMCPKAIPTQSLSIIVGNVE